MRERVPDLPIVAISGMTTLDFVSRPSELSDVVCLQKPFRPTDLVRAIEAARASRPAPRGSAASAVETKTPRRTGAFDSKAHSAEVATNPSD